MSQLQCIVRLQESAQAWLTTVLDQVTPTQANDIETHTTTHNNEQCPQSKP